MIIFFSRRDLVLAAVALDDRAGKQRAPHHDLRGNVLVVLVVQPDEAQLALLHELHDRELLRPRTGQGRRVLGLGARRGGRRAGCGDLLLQLVHRDVQVGGFLRERLHLLFLPLDLVLHQEVLAEAHHGAHAARGADVLDNGAAGGPHHPPDKAALLRVQEQPPVALHLAAHAGAAEMHVPDGEQDRLLGEKAHDVAARPQDRLAFSLDALADGDRARGRKQRGLHRLPDLQDPPRHDGEARAHGPGDADIAGEVHVAGGHVGVPGDGVDLHDGKDRLVQDDLTRGLRNETEAAVRLDLLPHPAARLECLLRLGREGNQVSAHVPAVLRGRVTRPHGGHELSLADPADPVLRPEIGAAVLLQRDRAPGGDVGVEDDPLLRIQLRLLSLRDQHLFLRLAPRNAVQERQELLLVDALFHLRLRQAGAHLLRHDARAVPSGGKYDTVAFMRSGVTATRSSASLCGRTRRRMAMPSLPFSRMPSAVITTTSRFWTSPSKSRRSGPPPRDRDDGAKHVRACLRAHRGRDLEDLPVLFRPGDRFHFLHGEGGEGLDALERGRIRPGLGADPLGLIGGEEEGPPLDLRIAALLGSLARWPGRSPRAPWWARRRMPGGPFARRPG